MKNVKHLLLLMFLSSIVLAGYAQEDASKKYREQDLEQLEMYEDGDYLFPPKPRNNWSIGVKGGLAFVAGDVRAQPGMGFGLDVRKAMGHVFSLRLQATAGRTHGQNWSPTNGYRNHAGNPWEELYNTDPNVTPPNVYYNFRMQYADVALQGLVNLNNINFYKEQSKWNIYAGAGLGVNAYYTAVDALDGNGNPYTHFNEVTAINPNDPTTFVIDGRRERLDLLQSRQDGVYETPAEGHTAENGIQIGGNNYVVGPTITGAVGLRYRLSRRVEIELEHRIAWANDDLLDGQRWQEAGGGGPDFGQDQTSLTRDFDSYNHTTLGIHFRLGPGEESLWWSNPLTEVYSSAQEAREIAKRLTDDGDKDGVPDLYDKEPDTPEGMPVDGLGRALDTDGDGVLDNDDEEPFTPKGCDVDQYGVALDADNDGVPDCYDKEPNSPPGMYYDAKGVAIIIENEAPEIPCLLPIVHFELDKDNIRPEFYPELYYIAQVMKNDPSIKVRATGHADVRNTDAYNEDLSRRRVQNAVDFLVNTYGIDPARFIMEYQGEANNVIQNLPANHANPKLEPLHYVNRRVEFECVRN
ncbi:MAG: OmpA family protein [Bacteroidetes bacterium]|nr:MAG: OmpA family protein [Bacteroidota bacterium]